MTQELVNIGAAPNDGTGDPARSAFNKVNNNAQDAETRLTSLENDQHVAVTLNPDSNTQESLALAGQELQAKVATPSSAGVMSGADKNNLDQNTADRHDAVTLNADSTTQESLNLSTQEIQVNKATGVSAGVMSPTDKNNLDSAEQSANKGVAGGYASLDGGGKVPISELPSSVQGGIKVIGSWNADTNTPDLSALSLDQGEGYIVTVAGNTNLNGETNWRERDIAFWDDSTTGNWVKLDNTDDVLSVFGRLGAVVAQLGDYTSSLITNLSTVAGATLTDALNNVLDKATYDPTNQAVDVYDKANETGVEQVTGTIITPPTLVADTDDYNPAGFSSSNMVRQDVSGGDFEITGIQAPPAGVNRVVYINNISTTGDEIDWMNNNAGSLPENRLLMRGDRRHRPNETVSFWYDHTSQRWRQLSQIG